ncbi:hypothetical protein VQL36_13295 [Chengkuizengella sp. SCS-71B]|uniref:hypothetical protein n=1 Tax=Chengkuizengella sp. SCS-71B TaxID=3115290 RepID=UPI0032C22B72
MASKKGFSRIATIVLVLFILLVIIMVAARGSSRYSSGGTIDFTNPEELLALIERLNLINEELALISRISQAQRALV